MADKSTTTMVSRVWLPAAAGVAAVVAGIGAAELTAALFAPTASPILVVGSLVIDLVPGWLKEFVIGLVGTNDKTVLLLTLGVVIVIGAAVAGVLEALRPPTGRILILLGGLLGAFAAITRTASTFFSAVPSLVALVVGVLLLNFLIRRLPKTRPAAVMTAAERRALVESERYGSRPAARSAKSFDRRGFLVFSGGLAVVGIVAALASQAISAGAKAAAAARAALKLPRATVLAKPVPADASFHIPGVAPIVTSNSNFYRIDTALQVPQIDPTTWKLHLTGMVENDITLTWKELLALPLRESYTTLTCVSNEVGGNLISNAKWLGYPIRELLARAKPKPGADMVFSTSQDGWTAATPLSALDDPNREAILAVGMNGQPLPFEHGFPVRMVVPGLYGYVSATKWLVKLEVTQYSKATSYWTDRGWSEKGPIKLESRIDVPSGGSVSAGNVVVAGVAWDQHTGIKGVQVQVDNGAWNDATLAAPISIDTWRQWRWEWPATRGSHSLRVRAINADGEVQTSAVQDVVPNGATGYHQISVTVN